MPLFHIQDTDRPAFVVANGYQEAVAKWQRAIAKESEIELVDPPRGVTMLCDDDELIIADDFAGA
jgi:hypothetical protein